MPDGFVAAAHLATTIAMTGLIWFVQIVHYPMMSRFPRWDFGSIEREHCDRTGFVAAPLMLVEAFTLGILLFEGYRQPMFLVSAVLLAIIWASTFFFQVPAHRGLLRGWNPVIQRRLVLTNWIRTIGWSARSVILLGIFL
jgi:hypothetical protein